MPEVRNRYEGALRWVQASGSGSGWATASGAPTALMGFVRNFTCADVRVVRVSRHTGSTSGDGATASADGLTDESTDDLGEQLVAEARRLADDARRFVDAELLGRAEVVATALDETVLPSD